MHEDERTTLSRDAHTAHMRITYNTLPHNAHSKGVFHQLKLLIFQICTYFLNELKVMYCESHKAGNKMLKTLAERSLRAR